jgi:ATP-binding cassette subfamily B protein
VLETPEQENQETAGLDLPEWVTTAVARVAPDAEVRLATASDLAEDGTFGERWVALVGERVLVLSPNGGDPEVQVDLPIKEISEVSIESLVGGGMLQAVLDGRKVDLLPYTSALTNRFARLRGQLDAIVKDKPLPVTEEEAHLCPSCGMPLGELTRVCPRCLRKGAVLRRLLGRAHGYRGQLVLVSVLMLLGSALSLVGPFLTKQLVDNVLIPRNPRLLGWLVLALALSSVIGTAVAVWRGRLGAWLGGRISLDIRSELYDRLQWLSMKYYDRHPTGAIISRLTQDSNGVQDFLAFGLPWFTINVLMVIGVAIMTLCLNWKLALIALFPTPLVSMLTKALWRRMHEAFHAYWYRWGRYYSLVSDALGRVRIIKAFSQQTNEIGRYNARNSELFTATIAAEQIWATVFPVINMMIGAGSLLVWYFGGWQMVQDPHMTLGTLMAFLACLGMLYGPMNSLPQLVQWMSRAMTAAERIFEVLDAESDREGTQGEVAPEHIRGEIEFRDVSFGYKVDQPILKEVSFSVEPGKMLGLVGKSGAGKTTIINLICRFYETDQGEILVDGIPLQDLSLWAYRGRLGAVLQEPFLFHGTIAENIAYAKPEATMEEIMAAAKIANAHDFIVNRPDGYDSQVGERGGNLSGGEKQRLCIARAILHDPAILILDEATANVDLETEEQIQEALARLTQGRTTIAIAHRISTLRNAHTLLVIEDGKVAENGTHEELEELKGKYYELLRMHQKTSMVEALHE